MKVVVAGTWLEALDERPVLQSQGTCYAASTVQVESCRCSQRMSNLTTDPRYRSGCRRQGHRFIRPQAQRFTFRWVGIRSPDMDAATSYVSCPELPGWPEAFPQEFNIVL